MRLTRKLMVPTLLIGTLAAPSAGQFVHAEPSRPVTAPENAALRYWRTWTFLSESDRDWIEAVDHDSIGEAGFSVDEATRTRLAEEAQTIEALIDAAGMTRCDFGVDYKNGPGALMTHLSAMRLSARLLSLDARLAFDAGEAQRGARSLAAAFEIAQHCATERIVISSLVSVVCFDVADRVARYASEAGMLGAEERDMLCGAIERFDERDPFRVLAAVEGESEVIGRWYLRLAADDLGTLRTSMESMIGEKAADPLVLPLEEADGERAARLARKQVSQFETYYRLAREAWRTPEAETRLAALAQGVGAGDFGPLTKTFGVALGNLHARDVEARAMFEARAANLGCGR